MKGNGRISGPPISPSKAMEDLQLASKALVSRTKLDSMAARLEAEHGFAGFLLTAAHVSPDKMGAALRQRGNKGSSKSDTVDNPNDDDAQATEPAQSSHSQRAEQSAAAAEVAGRPNGLDITTDDVSGSLLQWRAPSRMYVWGRGVEGQLACGTVNAQASVSRVVRPMRIGIGDAADCGAAEAGQAQAPAASSSGYVDAVPIRAACGQRLTAVVDNKRRLWVAGEGYFGRGKKERCHAPTLVAGLEKHAIVEVSIGKGFMLACTVDGVALVWGENEGVRQLEEMANKSYRRDVNFLAGQPKKPTDPRLKVKKEPTEEKGITSGTAQGHPLGFEPGSPYRVSSPRPVAALAKEQVIAVAAGEAHLVTLCASGRVYTWGGGSSGATGQGSTANIYTPTLLELRPHALRHAHGRGQARDVGTDGGSLASPSLGASKAFSALSSRERRRSIAEMDGAQAAGTLGLGRAKAGATTKGQAGVGSTAGTQAEESKYACAIAAGSHHTAVLARDGTVHVMGFAESGRLGLGHDRPEPVVNPTPLRVQGVNVFTAVACGGSHTLLVSADGRIFACGDNSFGQCGVNTRESRINIFERLAGGGEVVHAERRVLAPRQIFTPLFGDVLVVKVMAGACHSACVDLNGAMWTWGLNEEGSCGSGDEVTSPEPVKVARFREVRVIQAALGDAHTASIVCRLRHVPPGAIVAQLDDEDATGAAMTLEPPLPLNIRRERRQQLNVRRKAIAFCFARKRRLAKLARKRLLRRMISQHMTATAGSASYQGALAAADAATSSENAVEAVTKAKHSMSRRDVEDGASDAGSYSTGRISQPLHGDRNMPWELDPDSAEYGKNSAATILQGLFRRWIASLHRYRLAQQQQAMLAQASDTATGQGRPALHRGASVADGKGGEEFYMGPRAPKNSAVAALNRLQTMRGGAALGVPASPSPGPAAVDVPQHAGPQDAARRSAQVAALQMMGFSSSSVLGAV